MPWYRSTIVILLLAAPFSSAASAELQLRSWGPRVGLADDPDQGIVGAQFDLGEFAPRVRFIPNVELGLGDDHTLLVATAPVHYRWEGLQDTKIVPYAGGGVAVGWVDVDEPDPGEDDSDFELAFKAIGGAEWPLSGGRTSFFAELNRDFGDLHDIQVVVGWKFGD
jgi:hypothetical protein